MTNGEGGAAFRNGQRYDGRWKIFVVFFVCEAREQNAMEGMVVGPIQYGCRAYSVAESASDFGSESASESASEFVSESASESASEFESSSRSYSESESLLTMLTGGLNGLYRSHSPSDGGRIPPAAF